MSSGGLLTTMVLSGRCVAVCASMANLLTSYLFARRSYKDLYAILHLEKEPCEARHLLVQNVRGDLAFDAVSFRYHPEAPYVLENISFSIRAGERVGIIGPMGGGKTTLLKLVAGLAKPSEGVLLLDDYNMAHLNIEKVREHIGVVPQSPVLFHGTLEFNLLMGARCVTQEALQHALEISGIGSFVSKHPLGLKMHIAEGGKNLSRGQRQSVAIARALVGAPPILLLDEPTSSMDSAQEKVFVERMRTEMQGKTMLVVTHRPNILQIVDRILVIDQGRLAADGPRDAILAKLGQASCVQGGQA
jgi:ATP-binding cassette subfamily C protein LapB